MVLARRDVERLIDLPRAIAVVRATFMASARGQTVMPSKIYLALPGGNDFRAMPAFQRRPAACGLKWVNVHPRNPRRGLPTVMALIVMNDPATGALLAVMDGGLITKLRTAAAGAVAAEALARPESAVVGLLGCGAQSDAQVLALIEVLPVRHVQVWGFRSGEARRWCAWMRPRLPGIDLTPCGTVETCLRGIDVLVTVTPSRRPLVKREWVKPGLHINAIGADAPGKQELEPKILRDAVVVVDEQEQAIHGGELNVPVAAGLYDPRTIRGTLGEILIRRTPGRRLAEEVTVFDSTGLAVHDVALGHEVVRLAARRGIGRRIPWPS